MHSVVLGALGLACGFAMTAAAQSASVPSKRTVLQIDSSDVSRPSVSLDGRWVVFSRKDPDSGLSSIWMSSVSDPRAFRVTSDGFVDAYPSVSPTGDRVVFVSNRPNKDGRTAPLFVMSISIDPRTGRPNGPVRQVTTDSVVMLPVGAVSRDGKQLAYIDRSVPARVRVVSVDGGVARTVATKDTPAGFATTITADGRHVVFQDSGARLLKRAPLMGGKASILARTSQGGIMPVAHRDDRYVSSANWVAGSRGDFQLRDMSGRVLSHVTLPEARDFVLLAGGQGLAAVSPRRAYSLRRITLATGATEGLEARTPGWPHAVTNGSIIRVQEDGGNGRLVSVGAPGGSARQFRLPAYIEIIGGVLSSPSRHLLAFGRQTRSPELPRWGGRDAMSPRPAYLVDLSTGTSQKISDAALHTCCPRNWGSDETLNGIAELRGANVDVSAFDATGKRRLVRSFAATSYARLTDIAIHGMRTAYVDSISADQQALFVTMNGTAAPVRVATIRGQGDVALSWTADARRIAVAYSDSEHGARAVARVFDIADDGTASGGDAVLDLGGPTDYFERVAWLPDGSALLVMRDEDPGHSNYLILRPLDPSRPPSRINATGDDIAGFFPEASGKSIISIRNELVGSTIWTVPFLTANKR